MTCPSCHAEDTRVIDSRLIEDGATIRRRRECSKCHFRFTTAEQIEILSLHVQKRDGSEEVYDREKLLLGARMALHKRPVSSTRFRHMIHTIEQEIQTRARQETIASSMIGDILMKHLRRLDKVAYVRFASIYRQFEDVHAFAEEIKKFERKKHKAS